MMMLDRLRAEARDLLELVVVPGLAALLPWAVCFRIFRRASGWRFLYRRSCAEALAQARTFGFVDDAEAWLRNRRLVTLIDHADCYLALTRSDRWLKRHLIVRGRWPAADEPAILCTFHWAAGTWGLRHAGAAGLNAHALIAPDRTELLQGRAVRRWYSRRRYVLIAQALRHPPIEESRSLRPVLTALQAGAQVLATIDTPSDQVGASEAIDLLGRRARVPRALLRLATESRVPVTVYLTGIRLSDGKRTLNIHLIPQTNDPDALVRSVFALLDEAIRAEPAAWHFWEVASRYFARSPAVDDRPA